MEAISIQSILQFLKAKNYPVNYTGDEAAFVTGFANISGVQDNCIAWIKDKKYLTTEVTACMESHPSAVIVSPWKIESVQNCIVTDAPKEIFFSVLNNFFKKQETARISERATVETDRIGKNVSIGPGCYVCADAVLGDDVILHANVVIDCPCKIGRKTEIFAGTVIGTDGFGYYHHNGIPERVPHFGGVIIGESVDIGANTCIDRGCLGDTLIGNHVKIDDLCMIGHNVNIGEKSIIVAGSTICGSVVIGKEVYLAPETIIKNQVHIGEKTFVGMNTILNKNVEPMSMVIDFNQSAQILKNKDYRRIL